MSKALTYVEVDVPTFVEQSPEATQTFRFAMPTNFLPANIEAIACMESVSITPATVSLGKDLGQRASVTSTFNDFLHIFNGELFEQGTFWGKWRARYLTALRGRSLRVIRGNVGQALSDMDTRHYVIDTVSGPTFDGKYTIVAKDILKLADDDRAQAPVLSNGSLTGTISAVATTVTLTPTGIGDYEYPSSGWVCIGGNEICAFTRISDTLTLTRAQFGTLASSHDAGSRVQIVLRYTGNSVADIIYDLLTNYTEIPIDYIDLATWQEEVADNLNVIYARTISEPMAVKDLIAQLVEQAALAIWWDDRARQIRLQVLRQVSTDADTFDANNILRGSFSVGENPDKRLSQIWTYYGQRNPTDSGASEDNFRSVLATVDLAKETLYGSPAIQKLQAAWIETENAATRVNTIKLSRFKDPPRTFAFDLTRDTDVSLVTGYRVGWWGNQDQNGNEVLADIQVTRISIYPDRVHVEAEEMLAGDVSFSLVNTIFLTDTGAGQWEVPALWNNSDNSVHTIGAGGGGSYTTGSGAHGGGGGAYSSVSNITLTPGTNVDYSVGVSGSPGTSSSSNGGDGGDSFFGATTLASSIVGAKGGDGGVGEFGGGQGGQATSGVGTTKTSGGDGAFGAVSQSGGAGGGAGGPHGDGANGGASAGFESGGGGGADGGSDGTTSFGDGTGKPGGNNRFNFGGGVPDAGSGQEGGGGSGSAAGFPGGHGGTGEQIWTQTVAPIISAGPGGGGGGGAKDAVGGDGGDYGGGGGGGSRNQNGGTGAQGIIVIRWRESS